MIRIWRIIKYHITRVFNILYFSFPLQLFFNQIRYQKILLVFWAFLITVVTFQFGLKLGGAFLFLNPEYLGKVNGLSTFVLGITLGIFISAYHICSYMLNSLRFHFLFFVNKPFLRFCINNSLLPVFFIILFSYYFIDFQINYVFIDEKNAWLYLGTFYIGIIIVLLMTSIYFFNTEKDVMKFFGPKFDRRFKLRYDKMSRLTKKILEDRAKTEVERGLTTRVDYYFSSLFKVKRVPQHFKLDFGKSKEIMDNSQVNATYLILGCIVLFLFLGLMKNNTYFQIPAASSIMLLLSMFILLAAAFSFWFRKLSGFYILLVFIGLYYLNQSDWYVSNNKAFGLNYETKKASYNYANFQTLVTDENYHKDITNTIKILENWKKKNQSSTGKPKMIFINTTGGGLRSAVWTFTTLMTADSILKGRMFKQTALISGASGGMIGAAYYRELLLHAKNPSDIYNHLTPNINNLSKDLLNRIFFNITTSMFLPFQTFRDGKYIYTQDRGYSFELQFMENTHQFINKRLRDYTLPEQNAEIPIFILNPTIVNDGRKLYISSQNISYLIKPTVLSGDYSNEISGVEFTRFFADQDAWNLRFTSALRMNATFPYITPNVQLPSNPKMEVMDAGISDNFGTETTLKFIFTFKEWIEQNTSGVIVIQIRDSPQIKPIESIAAQTIIKKLFNPIGGFYQSIQESKDYKDDQLIELAHYWLKTNFDFLQFQYMSVKSEEIASLSWHLTPKEKKNIIRSILHKENLTNLVRLEELLK